MALQKINLVFISCVLFSCTKHIGRVAVEGEFPKEIAQIFELKCASAGCHNQTSKDAAAGLSLQTWNDMFEGARGGPVVIPYRPDFSTLCFFTNSDKSLGPVLQPTMPINQAPLSQKEFLIIKNWIANGAPNSLGYVKFSEPNLRKMYVTNRLCDVVSVIDVRTKLPMRYISVGNVLQTEFPNCIKVSPDNKFWLVSFFAPVGLIQKFNAESDQLIKELALGEGNWSSFDISADSKYGFFIDNSQIGKIAIVNLDDMKLINLTELNLSYPREIVLNEKSKKAYIGSESGNFISILDYSNFFRLSTVKKPLDLSGSIIEQSYFDPSYFMLSKTNNKCFIACQGSNEIRVINMANDSVINIIRFDSAPCMMSLSENENFLFASFPYDSTSFNNKIGSVAIISTSASTIIKYVHSGFQPFGLSYDGKTNLLAIVNGNLSNNGPAPHHTSGCGGRNGYVTYLDMNSMSMVEGKKHELAAYPCAIALKK